MTEDDEAAQAARRELDAARDALLEYIATRLATADRDPERANAWRLLARWRQARELAAEYGE